jgi:CheY-like chemotaxis protein
MIESAVPPGASEKPHPPAEQDADAARKQVILLVDDESLMQELGKELLEEQGYHVMIAGDGLEAVEVFRRHRDEIDLVILDLLMPKLDGGRTYIELKKIKNDLKAFFCTGYTPHEIIGPLLAEESLRALQKPFRPAEFVEIVREMLSSDHSPAN